MRAARAGERGIHGMKSAEGAAERPIDKNLFFQHTACDHFPCHGGVDPARFNCLLCYCPLYALGERCGGNFSYTESGVKNCRACSIPHDGDAGVRLVRARFPELAALAARRHPARGE